jgi:membrane-associated phospholipid phosphatase
MVALGKLASLEILIGVLLITGAWLVYQRQFRTAGQLLAVFAVGWLIAWGTQVVINRQRPQVFLNPIEAVGDAPSFPCEQTLLATVLYLSIPCLASRRWRQTLIGVGAILVFQIAVSRMYSGHSYVTDVFGGLLVGYALALVFRELQDEPPLAAG